MQRYRVIAEKANGHKVILTHTDFPGIAHIIAEHIALTHRDYASLAVQERLGDREVWRTVKTLSGGGTTTKRTVQINDTTVRYSPA